MPEQKSDVNTQKMKAQKQNQKKIIFQLNSRRPDLRDTENLPKIAKDAVKGTDVSD